MTGDEDGGYIRSPISPIDQMTGGCMPSAAFWRCCMAREKTGKGGEIKVSLFEQRGLAGLVNCRRFWEARRAAAEMAAPAISLCRLQAFEAADGPIMIGVANDNLCANSVGRHRLEARLSRPPIQDNADRRCGIAKETSVTFRPR